MPYATNALDGCHIHFEDDGGRGAPVVIHGGFLDPIDLVRASPLARSLEPYVDEFRLIYVDHRGHGKSDKPHDSAAYAMPIRVEDAICVLRRLGLDRAHFLGMSWGGRLGFGIGEHAPERVLSLIMVGQQPYAIDPEGPLALLVGKALAHPKTEGIEPLVAAFESIVGRYPEPVRSIYLGSDAAAMHAAWGAAINEGAISSDLRAWEVRCLIIAAAGDVDFHDQARHAADEIPGAVFLELQEVDHLGMDTADVDPVLPAVLRTLRRPASQVS
jgi:pimeloyl-ACP methyl ester carboxylesterase